MEKRTCRICQGLLSRYNPESVCSSCARQINTTPSFPVWLWDSLPLRRAFAELDLGAALTIIRTILGLSQLEFATLLGWSQSTVARAESGQRGSLYDIRRLLEVVDAVDMPRGVLLPLFLGESDEQIEREASDEVDMNRRRFGGGLVGLATAAGLAQVQIPTQVNFAHTQYLQSAAEKLYAQDQNVGGGVLIGDGLRLYHRARRMLDEADYSEEVGRQLMNAAGELAVCVGWLAYDGGDQVLSRDLYSEARLLADQSGDDGLAIRAMEKMSLQSTVYFAREEGQPGSAREAVRLSERAAELALRDPSPQLHALLAARQATAHAAAGHRQGFTVSITRAWHQTDRGLTGDGPVWLRFVTDSEIAAQEARGHLYLGDAVTASALYRRSLETAVSHRNSAVYRAGLAVSLAVSGDVAGAVAEGMIVLSALEGGITSPRTFSALRPVRSIAAQDRRAKDFCVYYDQFGSISA